VSDRNLQRIHTSLALALASLCASSCVQFGLARDTQLEPISDERLKTLAPGESTLEDALEQLGPPLLAWELPDQGIALAWGWSRTGGWTVMVSIPISDQGGALSADYASEGSKLRGAVLFFDRDWQLTSVRQGRLRELRDNSRPRPDTDVDD
jgi:hypothetical protein